MTVLPLCRGFLQRLTQLLVLSLRKYSYVHVMPYRMKLTYPTTERRGLSLTMASAWAISKEWREVIRRLSLRHVAFYEVTITTNHKTPIDTDK